MQYSKHLLTLSFILGIYVSSWGCRCLQEDAEFMHFINFKYVFLGYVCTVNDCGDNNKYEVKMYVESVYKGQLSNKLQVYTDCVTSCKFKLESGKTYLFYTNLNNNTIGFCERRLSEDDSDFKRTHDYLNKIKTTNYNSVDIEHDSSKIAKLTVRSGALDGLVEVYYPDGKMRLKGVYVKGQAYGNFEITNHDKRFVQVWSGNYENDEREGKWVYKRMDKEDKKQMIYEIITYKQGEEIDRLEITENDQVKFYEGKIKGQ